MWHDPQVASTVWMTQGVYEKAETESNDRQGRIESNSRGSHSNLTGDHVVRVRVAINLGSRRIAV